MVLILCPEQAYFCAFFCLSFFLQLFTRYLLMTLFAGQGNICLKSITQWASKFQFSLSPTFIILANVATNMVIRGQTATEVCLYLIKSMI